MIVEIRGMAALSFAFVALHLAPGQAQAQWGYGYGWGGWGGGGGASSLQGDVARGMGVYAAGAGQYNQQTAVARSINTDTWMRWNQYVYESQLQNNKNERERIAKRVYGTTKAHEQILARLRDTPTRRDIYQGDALNVAFDEINDPRVYTKSLKAAGVKVGGESIRDIPFSYASAAISVSIHQITQGGPPEPLKAPEFDTERNALKALGAEIRAQIQEDGKPKPETLDKALAAVHALEAKVDATLPKNSKPRVESEKYLKAVHGLLGMMQTPALDILLAGADKRPDATLGELLSFMNAFSLRFGPATSVRQKEIYDRLYPELVKLREAIAPALASASPSKPQADAPHEMFSDVPLEALQKKAPAPTPAPPPPADPK